MKKLIVMAILAALALSAAGLMLGCGKDAHADFTVNKTMSVAFHMWNPDGSPRTNCDLSKFTVKDATFTAVSTIFTNLSGGNYLLSCKPEAPGNAFGRIFDNNTDTTVTFSDTVRKYDPDTLYTLIAAIPTNVAVLPFSETNGYANPVTSGMPIQIYSGDDVSIPYTLLSATKAPIDLTGYTVKFAVKRNINDAAYVIPVTDITAQVSTPTTGGAGLVTLTHAETAKMSGQYTMDVVIYNGSGLQNLAARFNLTVNARALE